MSSELKCAIALTGSIGCGKSTIVSVLGLYGFKSICADSIAHQMLESHSDEVIEAFGRDILDENGKIMRKKLGAIVFSDDKKREILQNILHTHIKDEIFAKASALEKFKQWYFIDIPLFFEVGGKATYPVARSLVVYVPEKKVIERIMKRDNFSLEEAQTRLKSQISIEEKCRLADDIIGNDSDLRALQQRVESYLRSLPPCG